MNSYAVLRRCAWGSPEELSEALLRSRAVLEWLRDDIRWIRSYALTEADGSVGTICLYTATSPEAVRAHAARAGLRVDEILGVSETFVVQPDPVPVRP